MQVIKANSVKIFFFVFSLLRSTKSTVSRTVPPGLQTNGVRAAESRKRALASCFFSNKVLIVYTHTFWTMVSVLATFNTHCFKLVIKIPMVFQVLR